MFNLLHKASLYKGFTVKDLVETEKRRLFPFLPSVETHIKLLYTTYALCVYYTDSLVKRYGTLEDAIAAGEKGEAFIARAIRANDDDYGGTCGWIKRNFPLAAASHPKVMEARDIMQEMGVLAYDSNGRGNVGYTRINVPSILVLTALLEDILGMTPANTDDATEIAFATYTGFSDDEMTERIEAIESEIEQPEYAVPPIAKIMKSRCKNFFGYNLRAKDAEYSYPTELESLIQATWAAIATVAQPVTTIRDEFIKETIKYCRDGAKRVIKRAKYLARTLENELAYQEAIATPF